MLKKDAKVIVLFDASELEIRKIVDDFKKKLQEKGAKTLLLGFINAKEFPADVVFKQGVDYFNNRDINKFSGLPKSELSATLSKHQADFFIAAFTEKNYPLLSIAAETAANFRIGPFLPKFEDCFDFMIDIKDSSNLTKYLEVVYHYIKALK